MANLTVATELCFTKMSTQRRFLHIVPERENSIRLQEYGAGIFPLTPTRSALKKAIKRGLVSVNGTPASTATFITGGEHIELQLPDEEEGRSLQLKLELIYEDDWLAAISKPPGIAVSGNAYRTVARALEFNLKPSTLEDATLAQPVHRLDYPTTGVLLAGKTAGAISALNSMFENKQIRKSYYAVTIGQMSEEGRIELEIEGKPSTTDYRSIQTVDSERFGYLNLVEFKPLTGRRHQIRIHSSSIGNPILGDREYCTEEQLLKGKGLYLHAFSLSLEHPFTGEGLDLIAELPMKFRKIFPDL